SVEQLALAADEPVAGVRCVGGVGLAPTRALLLAVVRVALASDDLVLVDAPIAFDALTASLAQLAQRTLFLAYDEPMSAAALPSESDDVWLIGSQCARSRVGERNVFRALPRDERVSEVMVNGLRGVWVEREGRLERAAVQFASEDEIVLIIERLVAPLGRRIDLANPLVDARLADGSRVHAAIPPISLAGPI